MLHYLSNNSLKARHKHLHKKEKNLAFRAVIDNSG